MSPKLSHPACWLASRWGALFSAVVVLAGCGGGMSGGGATPAPEPTNGDATEGHAVEQRSADALAATSTVTITARAVLAQNVGPIMALRVNGTVVASQEVRASANQIYNFSVPAVAPDSAIDLVFTNDWYRPEVPEDRNLFVQDITIDGRRTLPTDSGVTYDLGEGNLAFDGVNVIPGQVGFYSGGALRFRTPAASPAPVPAPPPSGPVPVVITAPASAKPGDIITLQGDNFGTAAKVWLEPPAGSTAGATALPVVNRVGAMAVSVQLPTSATGALVVRVESAGVRSAAVKLNAAQPHHLDTLQLVPGTRFRVFGRSLRVAGAQPQVRVDGQLATVDLAQSDEHMLVATAPAGLTARSAVPITVDNGNGTGAASLARSIEVVLSGTGDPWGTGVGWTAGFSPLTARVVNAATDTRLAVRAACNGSTNDTPALQAAVDLAASLGGGVVQLPTGTCRLAAGIGLKSRVVVQGTGKTATVLRYEQDYPFWGSKLDLTGLRNLSLSNAGAAREGMSLVQSSRVLMHNVRFDMGTSHQLFFTDNRLAAFVGNEFVQGGSVNEQGPFVMNGSAGLSFLNNTVRLVNGANSFQGVHDAWLSGNHFTRDARPQNSAGVVHAMVLDFAHRVAVTGNTFDVAYGPITNHNRNDGETILTEGGGAARTENLGTVATATATTLRDPSNTINVDPFGTGSIPENYGVAIVAGKGLGQTRRVTAYANATLTVDRAWDVVPDASSRYATFVWGLEKSLIKGNTLSQNPRGIWLYQASIRDVEVVGNTLTEGGGIYLRSYQSLSNKAFNPIYNVRIQGNRISNTTGLWASGLNTMFINADARAFGTGLLGLEIRDNAVQANQPNLSLPTEEYAGTEGYTHMMRVENYDLYEPMTTPRILGTVFQRNQCTNCEVAVRLGTGVGGTVLASTSRVNTPTLMTNTPVTDKTQDVATDTVVLP